MKKLKNNILPIAILIAASIACNLPSGESTPPPQESYSVTDAPSSNGDELPAQATDSPTEAPATECKPSVATTTLANVRSGPGLAYGVVASLPQGSSANVAGKNTDSSWWYIEFAAAPGGFAWIAGSVTNPVCIPQTLAIITAPPPPVAVQQPAASDSDSNSGSSNSNSNSSGSNQQAQVIRPTSPTNVDITRQCSTANNGFNQTTQFTWDDTDNNESGFHIYKDGQNIATLGPNSQKYVDQFFVDQTRVATAEYGVSSFNDGGESPIQKASVAYCK